MIEKDIEKINEQDLQSLIENSVVEQKKLEYKQSLPSSSDGAKKEFLADVSSLANASGGNIVYGIAEDRRTGVPKAVEGLDIENADQEITRLETMIRDGIEPRIGGLLTRCVNLSNSRKALIIRIPKSWAGPHRVTFKGHDKFYSRSTNGKYPLDVGELRAAFALSETITEKIRRFRVDRISNILAGETPAPLRDSAKIVLHLVPVISFKPGQAYDISQVAFDPANMIPIHCPAADHRYNLDGFLTYSVSMGAESRLYSYTQLFRNGIIEAVDVSILQPDGNKLQIPYVAYEGQLINSVTNYLSVLRSMKVEPPIFTFLTLVGVKGYVMGVKEIDFYRYGSHEIDRDIVCVPEGVIESYDIVVPHVLRPSFDSVWNACGYPKSFNFDKIGNWLYDQD